MIDFPNIDPVAFSVFGMPIRWYALAYIAGFLLGWQYCLYLAGLKKEGERPNKTDIDDYLPWAILGVIVGGRIGYVFFYQPELYLADPLEAFRLWHGGMSFHGGILGVIVSMIIYTYVHKISFLRLADMLACVVPIGLFFGRIANFVNGELFGRVTNVSWGVVFPRGGEMPRHPSQLYEAILEGLLLLLVLWIARRYFHALERPGVASGIFLAGYGISRVIVEFFREPDLQIGLIGGVISMGQVLSIPMILGGVVLIGYGWARGKQDQGEV